MPKGYFRSRSRSMDRDRKKHKSYYDYPYRRSDTFETSEHKGYIHQSDGRYREPKEKSGRLYHSAGSTPFKSFEYMSKSVSPRKTDIRFAPSEPTSDSKIVSKESSSNSPLESSSETIKTTLSSEKNNPENTSTISQVKDTVKESEWKGFPFPKFYKKLDKYYEPIPKSFDKMPPNLYFPIDGPKLRRYKNYRSYNDPLSRYKDSELFRENFKNLMCLDLKCFKRKLELIEHDLKIASLHVPTEF